MENNCSSHIVNSKGINRAFNIFFVCIKKMKTFFSKNEVTSGNGHSIDEDFVLFKNKDVFLKNKEDISPIKMPLHEIAAALSWPEITDQVNRENGLSELLRLFSLYKDNNVVGSSSNCWTLLATKNCNQLLENGFNNFKRTIGNNYFNFLVQEGDIQIKTVESLLPAEILQSCRDAALTMPNDPAFPAREQFSYYYFVLLLWEYVKRIDTKNYLNKVEEPKEGNPILVHADGKSMSQDLANSLIEYYSIDNAVSFRDIKTVLEIGGGYGRDAYLILSLCPNARVVMVDIMPALYIAQRYLSSVFKGRKVFRARDFSSYAEVKNEMQNSSIIFLLPHQLALLPAGYFDLSINISSFGEMSLDQIQWYFDQINRLTSKYFYMKQWDLSQNPFDGLKLHKSDYPVPENWKEIYSRNCAIQNEFFETLYQVNEK